MNRFASMSLITPALLTSWFFVMPLPASALSAESVPDVYIADSSLVKQDLGAIDLDPAKGDLAKAIAGGALGFYCAPPGSDFIKNGATRLPLLQECEQLRRISKEETVIKVVRLALSLDGCKTTVGRDVNVTFDETRRESLLSQGAKSVLEFLAAKEGVTATPPGFLPPPPPPRKLVWCTDARSHVLRHKRSVLNISASYVGAKDGEAGPTSKMITGPAEHLFLSGDAVVRGADQIAWDPTSRTLVSRDKPNQLYLSVNYMLGDLYSKHDSLSKDRLVVKLMIQPSKRPFDSFGVGLGYRFSDGVFTLGKEKDTGGFMVFAGAFWTRGDALNPAGAVTSGKREKSIRLGVSYSLDTLIGWIK